MAGTCICITDIIKNYGTFPQIKYKKFPAQSNARWNSRGILILLCFTLKPEFREELTHICDFVSHRWCDVWFTDQHFNMKYMKNLKMLLETFERLMPASKDNG